MSNPASPLAALIVTLRGQKVLFDHDLASTYGVPTKIFNQAVKRNADRFPEDFAFQLTREEWAILRSQIVTSKSRGGRRYPPYAFTEHGALMAATVLNSPKAVSMSIHVVRAFVRHRSLLLGQAEILQKLAQMDAKLMAHDDVLRRLWEELQPLLAPPPDPPRRGIGFQV